MILPAYPTGPVPLSVWCSRVAVGIAGAAFLAGVWYTRAHARVRGANHVLRHLRRAHQQHGTLTWDDAQ